jgi:biopolymer transport protein ExbB/TolQ
VFGTSARHLHFRRVVKPRTAIEHIERKQAQLERVRRKVRDIIRRQQHRLEQNRRVIEWVREITG